MPIARSSVQNVRASIFPLRASADGRYLVQSNGVPFPILGRASWYALSLSEANRDAYLNDTISKGFNAVEIKAIGHDSRNPTVPQAGNGSLPFSKRLDGGAWSGSLTYTTIGNEAPDFTTPNETYWGFVDSFINTCETLGLLVLMFPAYCGFGGGAQGYMAELVANGSTKCQAYGAWLATRYRTKGNIVWILGGDYGTGTHPFSGGESTVEGSLITGLKSVTGQSTFFNAEWDSPSIATDQATHGSNCNLIGGYSFDGNVATYCGNAYSANAGPAHYLEGPYDEEGADGTGVNSAASQPVRRFNWWGWLRSIGGYMTGNGFVWMFGASWQSHLSTTGALDCKRMNDFIKSINWNRLVPHGLGSIGTLVTSGLGTIDTTSYTAAAATPQGDLLVAYLGTGTSGSVTIDMTKMRGTTTARWFDPTNASYTAIGSFSNTGTQSYTTPGNNSAGAADWVLRLDA